MKKLMGIILLALLVAGCVSDYKDLKPKEITGVKLEIDSTKWQPALIQVDDSRLTIYEDKEIRHVQVIDQGKTAILVLFLLIIVFLIGIGVGLNNS